MTNSSTTFRLMVLVILAAVSLASIGCISGCGEQGGGPATAPSQPSPTQAVKPPTPTPAPTQAVKPPTPAPTPAPAAGDFQAFAKKQEVPCARVAVVKTAPVVDGKLDDVYKSATPLGFSFLSGGEGKPTAATTVYAVSTDKELFLFFNCQSPDMEALAATIREHDGQLWSEDSVEIFLDPSNKRQYDTYMHIIVNALGTTAEAKGPKGDEDYSWNPKLQVKTVQDKKGWTVELAIPFAELVPDVKKMNRVWAVNFNRLAMLFQGNEDTAWSPTGGTDSHVPEKFGALWLDAGPVDNTK